MPPATTTSDPAPWAPVAAGPYEVGVVTLTLDDPTRPLTVDVWFPIDADLDASTLPPQRYTFLPDIYYESPTARAAAGAEQLAGDGPFPLIVYSHGSSGLRWIHSAYTEALASHGYVVVAADHTGNTIVDYIAGSRIEPAKIALDRPDDVSRLIDAFTDGSHPTAGDFAETVDANQIVVTGHSVGGFTAVAGVVGYANDLGEVAPDERIDAIVLLAPATGPGAFPDEAIARIDVPMMVVVGTNDTTTPIEPNVTRLWNLAPSAPAYRVELVDAQHQTFTDVCAYQEFVPQLPGIPQILIETIDEFAVEGCSPGDMDHRRAAELTNSYVVRFLDQVVRGGPPIDATAMAPPGDVTFDAR